MPNNPPAGTPNAVEEAYVGCTCQSAHGHSPRERLVWHYGVPNALLDEFTAAVRTQAFAEVRRVVIEASNDAPAGTRHTTLTHILAALDALERGP